MVATVPRRRERIAFAAGLAAIAGLMTVVALSGAGTKSKLAIDTSPAHVAASKEP